MKNTFTVLWKAFTTLLTVVMLLLAVALVGVRLAGFTPYAVLSGSMTPTYQVGDLIYAKETDFAQIQKGDVISFVADEKLTVVTHRVAAVDEESRSFQTKGDANDATDAKPVLYQNVLGVVRFSLPKLGYVSSYLTSTTGRYVCAAAAAGLIMLMILPELFKKDPGKEKKDTGGDARS